MPGGRKTKRTPRNRGRILEGLRLGMTYKLAAQYAGMGERTLYEWLAADAQFSHDCKDAEAHNERGEKNTILVPAYHIAFTEIAILVSVPEYLHIIVPLCKPVEREKRIEHG